MKLFLTTEPGFCYGVKKAVKIAESTVKKYKIPVFTIGPLMHNQLEINRLIKLGIRPLNTLKGVFNKTLLIRTHGLPKNIISDLEAKRVNLIDTTCPIVKSVQKLVEKMSQKGYSIVIVGKKNHPETVALVSYSLTPVEIINSKQEATRLVLKEPIAVVSQTTQLEDKFRDIVSSLKKKFRILKVFNTICKVVKKRQKEAEEIAKEVDLMLVIGGKNSSNTARLKELSAKYTRTYQIESSRDIKISWLANVNSVGIIAGTSTPDWIVKDVVRYLNKWNLKKQ